MTSKKFVCLPCGRTFSCGHSGQSDIKKYSSYDNNKIIVDSWKRQSLFSCRQAESDKSRKYNAFFLVQHNLPLAIADYLGHIFGNQTLKL